MKILRHLFRQLHALGKHVGSYIRHPRLHPATYADISKRINRIEGWLWPEQEKWLFEAARTLAEGALIVEIGSFKGRSTCCLGYGILGTNKRVVAIDVFSWNDTNRGTHRTRYYDEFLRNVRRNNLEAYIEPIPGRSQEVAKAWTRPIGMLFIDGSHEYEDVRADFENFYPHVVAGGLVALHDVAPDWPGPERVWSEIVAPRLENTGHCSTLAFGTKPRDKGHAAQVSSAAPVISIFMPVYNSAKYLAQALDSLFAQTFQDFEIIIADDGSTDQSLAIAQAYAKRDARLKVVALPHQGEVNARNEALRHAHPNAKYLMNHDSDDISLPTKLERLVAYLATHPEIAIAGSFAEYIDARNKPAGRPKLAWQAQQIRRTFGEVNSMINSAALIRREVFDKIGVYREAFRSVDDYDFFARALLAGFELANIPEPLHKIRLHPASIGNTSGATQRKLAAHIREYYRRGRQ